jgi:TPP-dependent pyruvate/acetoin dehydrogenase alpha subunit
MEESAPRLVPPNAGQPTAQDRAHLLRLMMLARAAEQPARTLTARENGAPPAARSHRDPIGAGAVAALGPGDCVVASGRYLAAHLDTETIRSVGRSSSAPDLVPIAVGVALAVWERGSGAVVLTLLDEGAMATERWSEALALATARQLPLALVVERDARGASSPGPVEGVNGQPMLGEVVDGEDPEAVLTAVRAAVDRARGGRGPALVACTAAIGEGSPLIPWRASHPGEPGGESVEVDPTERYARRLMGMGMPRAEIDSVLREVEEKAATWPP